MFYCLGAFSSRQIFKDPNTTRESKALSTFVNMLCQTYKMLHSCSQGIMGCACHVLKVSNGSYGPPNWRWCGGLVSEFLRFVEKSDHRCSVTSRVYRDENARDKTQQQEQKLKITTKPKLQNQNNTQPLYDNNDNHVFLRLNKTSKWVNREVCWILSILRKWPSRPYNREENFVRIWIHSNSFYDPDDGQVSKLQAICSVSALPGSQEWQKSTDVDLLSCRPPLFQLLKECKSEFLVLIHFINIFRVSTIGKRMIIPNEAANQNNTDLLRDNSSAGPFILFANLEWGIPRAEKEHCYQEPTFHNS